jgi:hypothetical protein
VIAFGVVFKPLLANERQVLVPHVDAATEIVSHIAWHGADDVFRKGERFLKLRRLSLSEIQDRNF